MNANSPDRSNRSGAALRAVFWALAGGILTLIIIADPLRVHPLDEWIGSRLEKASEKRPAAGAENRLWSCGMHPEVLEREAGTCPICQMDLVPLDADQAPGDNSGTWSCAEHPMIEESSPGECPICGAALSEHGHEQLKLGPAQGPAAVTIDPAVVQKMNVTMTEVVRRDLSRRIRTIGYLAYDETRMVSIATRYSGFVEKVYVDLLKFTMSAQISSFRNACYW